MGESAPIYLAIASMVATGASAGVSIHNANAARDQADKDRVAMQEAQDKQLAEAEASRTQAQANIDKQAKDASDAAASADAIANRNRSYAAKSSKRVGGGRQGTILTGSQGIESSYGGKTLLGG